MPTVTPYANKNGLYIRAAQGGRMATYQVTSEGQRLLQKSGLGSGGEISPSDLNLLRERGLIYTGGTGAGSVDQSVGQSEREAIPSTKLRARPYNSNDKNNTTHGLPVSSHDSPNRSIGNSSLPPLHTTDETNHSQRYDNAWYAWVGFGGSAWLFGSILSAIYENILPFTMIIFLFVFFGLISGFLSSSKGRLTSEGFWLGQICGPFGLLVVMFMPSVDSTRQTNFRLRENSEITHCEPNQRSETLRILAWSLGSFAVIILLMVLAVALINH